MEKRTSQTISIVSNLSLRKLILRLVGGNWRKDEFRSLGISGILDLTQDASERGEIKNKLFYSKRYEPIIINDISRYKNQIITSFVFCKASDVILFFRPVCAD